MPISRPSELPFEPSGACDVGVPRTRAATQVMGLVCTGLRTEGEFCLSLVSLMLVNFGKFRFL